MRTAVAKRNRVKPNPGTGHWFDPATGKMIPMTCTATTLVQVDGCVHAVGCEVPEVPHAGMPHTTRVVATEFATDAVFVWWDTPVEEIDQTDASTHPTRAGEEA